VPAGLSGTYYWGAYVDAGTYWSESNENNNALAGNSVLIDSGVITSFPVFVPLYRLYKYDSNNNTRDHFFTTNPAERNNAISNMGYKDEGVECFISNQNFAGALPLYRLFLGSQNSHYYTTSDDEKNSKISAGYTLEGVQGYLAQNDADGLVPIHRMKQTSGTVYHYFLCSKLLEYNYVKGHGYVDETPASLGYVQPNTAKDPMAHGRPQGNYAGTDLASGAFRISGGTHLAMQGKGPFLSFSFYYNSFDMNHYPYPMGPGWKHSLESRIDEGISGDVLVTWPGGAISCFEKTGDGYTDYLDKSGNHDQLTRVDDGVNYGYDILKKDQSVYRFRKYSVNPWPGTPQGEWFLQENTRVLLLDITDWAGNKLTYSREAAYGTIVWVSDNYGRKLVLTYSTPKLQLQKVEETVDGVAKRSLSFSYNPDGTLAKFTDPRGKITRYSYNADALLSTVTLPENNIVNVGYNAEKQAASIKENENPAATISYDPAANVNVTTVQDPRGKTSSWSHSGFKLVSQKDEADLNEAAFEYTNTQNPFKPTRVVDKEGNATLYEYDSKGNLTKITNANLKVAKFEYNDKNNLTKSWEFHNPSTPGNPTIYTYDEAGKRLISVTNPENETTWIIYDPAKIDCVASIRDPKNKTTIFQYDPYGNLSSVTDPEGNATVYQNDYAGRVFQVTDAKNKNTLYAFDESDALRAVTNHLGHRVDLFYNGNGQLGEVRWLNAETVSSTVYGYNPEARLKTVTKPLMESMTYTYDSAGNLATRKDYNQATTTYGYDESNRLNLVSYPGTSVAIERNDNGHITAVIGPEGSSRFEYNNLNLIKKYTDPYGKIVQYDYNDAGRLFRIVYPGAGKTVTYGYDQAGRLISVQDWVGGLTTYVYDDAGNIERILRPNGTQAFYGYDSANRLVGITERKPDGSAICSYTYGLDPVGNITSIDSTEPLSPSPPVVNLSYTTDRASNRLLTAGPVSFTYDNNGNRKTSSENGGTTYYWNNENMLVQIDQVSPANVIMHSYDGLNNRIKRIEDGGVTKYVLDLSGEMSRVLAETDNNGNIVAYYVYGAGLLSRITSAGERQFYHYNNRGDTIALTNSTGDVTDSYAYDEYGQLLQVQGSTLNPFKFVGKYGVIYEKENLYFMRARYYDAKAGRFLSEDPIGFQSEGWNTYEYATNNPQTFIDYKGEVAQALIAAAIPIAASAVTIWICESIFKVSSEPIGYKQLHFAERMAFKFAKLKADPISFSMDFFLKAFT
jgi:RHS repeat-associated protein